MGSEGFPHFFPFFFRFSWLFVFFVFFVFRRFSLFFFVFLLSSLDKSKRLQFPGKMGNFTPTPSAATPSELPERICLGIFALKKEGIFGEFFLVSVSRDRESKYENSEHSWKFRSKIRDDNSIGLPQKGVRKRGCKSSILRLFAFVCVCLRLFAFVRVFGPISGSLKSAFVCVCARSFAFACVCKHPLLLHPLS